MKKIYTLFLGMMLTVNVIAQSPEKISYQAVIRDAGNSLITNQVVGMRISILQSSTTGIAVYVEKQTPTSNTNGLVSLEIGTGTIVNGDFTTIDWATGTYFIKIEIDLNGGSSYTITGVTQLLSVPYALHAKTAESITGTITEIDPVYTGSVANGITSLDTANWNNHTLDTDTQLDSIGVAALGFVAGNHTDLWDTLGNDISNTNSGNVGIGVASPKSKLQLANNLASGALDNFSEYQLLLHEYGTPISSTGIGVKVDTLILNTNASIDFDIQGVTSVTINSDGIVQENWISPTLLNGWINYGAGYAICQYYKDKEGVIHVKGLVRNGIDLPIFVLPVGYRPTERRIISTITNPNATARVDVLINGEVRMMLGDYGWLSLEFSFRP